MMEIVLIVIASSIPVVGFIRFFAEDIIKNIRDKKEFNNALEQKYNEIYLCENSDCQVKFFRLHQFIFGVKSKDLNPDNLESKLHVGLNRFEIANMQFEDVACVHCGSKNHALFNDETGLFGWMGTDQRFPELTANEIRVKWENLKLDFNSNIAKVEELNELLRGKASIEAFQSYYQLENKSTEIEKMEEEVLEQLKLFKELTPYNYVKAQVDGAAIALILSKGDMFNFKFNNLKKVC